MYVVQCVTRTTFVAFRSMPLLTELVSSKDGFCYRHGAPNGAVAPSLHSAPPKTVKQLHMVATPGLYPSKAATQKASSKDEFKITGLALATEGVISAIQASGVVAATAWKRPASCTHRPMPIDAADEPGFECVGMNYTIRRANAAPQLLAEWSDPVWEQADPLEIQHFRTESSDHHPRTSARLLYDALGIHGMFRVEDRYLRCLRTQYQDPVWKDSCVEFFAQPMPERGYFNFEFNCGGALL